MCNFSLIEFFLINKARVIQIKLSFFSNNDYLKVDRYSISEFLKISQIWPYILKVLVYIQFRKLQVVFNVLHIDFFTTMVTIILENCLPFFIRFQITKPCYLFSLRGPQFKFRNMIDKMITYALNDLNTVTINDL